MGSDDVTVTPAVLPPDQAARDFAVNPAHDVVLEASAGTGKTRVLVERYVRLLAAGVDPRNVLAITFTRKAAAEMRGRILAELQRAAESGQLSRERARGLGERVADIQISTIDAFCFGLLREFPLEADVDPGFDVADETEIARFAGQALDRALRIVRGALADHEPLRLLLVRVKWPVLRDALAGLLDRRHVAMPAIAGFLRRQSTVPATGAEIAAAFLTEMRRIVQAPNVRRALIDDGPVGVAEFRWLHRDLTELDSFSPDDQARVQQFRRRAQRYFLTTAGKPRQRLSRALSAGFPTSGARRRHEQAVAAAAPAVHAALDNLDRAVDVLLARGLQQLLGIAASQYERLLDDNALLDFAGMLDRAVRLLRRQEEFARSRMKLQTRYHHLLVDEFQDTSRLQWELISLLVDAWGEGEGATDAPTSIFVVGDRKQSIYRFRHAEVRLLEEAAGKISLLRPNRPVRQAITASFRAVPELLTFVNALADAMQGDGDLDERFTYDSRDRFVVPPVSAGARRDGVPVLGLIAEPTMDACARAVAAEIERLLSGEVVRDRAGGSRPARPDDIAVLFRARSGHQAFERALDDRGIRSYVYKGLGFFDAPEVQDLQAVLRYLAQPESPLRAAEFLRSRVIRLSDVALARLAPDLDAALDPSADAGILERLDAGDRERLEQARLDVARWRQLVDRVRPGELIDRVIEESAYAIELRGPRAQQARENLKKMRALVRRVENRGYATIGRIAAYFDTLRAGDESNAIIEAAGAVHLMTVHSAKGLEFPIVFVVNLHVGGRGRPPGFSVIERSDDGQPEVTFRSTPGTKLEERRDQEELRRLWYVAVTRARDRLYLAAEVDPQGGLRRSARSLASLLPPTLANTFAEAASTAASEVTWSTAQDTFDWRVCRAPEEDAVMARPARGSLTREVTQAPPLTLSMPRRQSATLDPIESVPSLPATASPALAPADIATLRLAGVLVHRLLQQRADPSRPDADLIARAMESIEPAERVDAGDVAAAASRAVNVFKRLAAQPDVAAALAAGTCYFEVPFSIRLEDAAGSRIVRGVIDAVVISPDGPITILEFKTGTPRPEHQRQAAIYGAAAHAVFGRDDIEIKVLYP